MPCGIEDVRGGRDGTGHRVEGRLWQLFLRHGRDTLRSPRLRASSSRLQPDRTRGTLLSVHLQLQWVAMPSHQGCHDFAFHPTWPTLGLCVFRLVLDYILAVEFSYYVSSRWYREFCEFVGICFERLYELESWIILFWSKLCSKFNIRIEITEVFLNMSIITWIVNNTNWCNCK